MQFNPPPPNPSLSSTHTAHHYSQPQTNQTPTPSPYHNALYNTLFSLLSHYYPKSVSMHSPAPPDPTLSLNIIPKTYHYLYIMITPPPPHSYSSSKIHRSSRTLTFNPQSLIHIFFSDCAILYSIMSPKLLPEV